LLLAVAVSSWQAVKAKRAERQANEDAGKAAVQAKVASQQTAIARTESENALAAKDFLIENLLGVDSTRDAQDSDAATFEATQALARKVARNMEGKFTNQPLTEADIRMALGKVFLQAKDFTQTVFQAQRALDIRRAQLRPDDTNIVSALQRLAAGKFFLGQSKEAYDLITNAIAIARAGGSAASLPLAGALGVYGSFLIHEGRGAEALPYLNESLTLGRRIADPKSVEIKGAIIRIIEATRQTGDSERADAMLRDLLEQSFADHGPDHPMTAELQMGLGRRLVEQQRWEEGLPLLERSLAAKRMQMGPNNFSTLVVQLHLGQAYEQKGDIPAAAKLYADLHPRYVKYLPYYSAIHGCTEVARFFVRHGRYEEAKRAFGAFRDFYDTKPPEYPGEFDPLIEATAPTKGWAAVAKVYRAYRGRFERDATYQRNMASAFLYGDDREGYQQTVTNAFARALIETNIDEQRRLIEVIVLGRCEFSADQLRVCETFLSLARTNTIWHRPMAALLLRLGRFEQAIQRLDLALRKNPSTMERARLVMLKSICLSQSREAQKARAAFDEAEALMRDRLLARLPKEEGFIDHDERSYLIHRREAQALLTEKTPN
jgi:tetratricopeptide (TPR) repeat protein